MEITKGSKRGEWKTPEAQSDRPTKGRQDYSQRVENKTHVEISHRLTKTRDKRDKIKP